VRRSELWSSVVAQNVQETRALRDEKSQVFIIRESL